MRRTDSVFKNVDSENTAVILENDNRITYQELFDKAELIFDYIGKRCLAFLICDNHIECLAAYVGMINNHVVVAMIDKNMSGVELYKLLKLYQPEFIWMPQKYNDKLGNDSMAVILKGYQKVHCMEKYELYKYCSCVNEFIHKDVALLMPTSGTIGSPKWVRISYNNLFDNAKVIIDYLKISQRDITITTLPMNYSYGLSIINSHILAGACVVMSKRNVLDRKFWESVKKNKVKSFGGIPYIYELLHKINFYQMDLPDLTYVTQAGGRLPVNLQKKFGEYAIKTGKKFIIMYGQTEATARISYLPYQDCVTKLGSIGKAIPNGIIDIIDENNHKIAKPGINGEIVYRGNNVAMGYAYTRADLNKNDEWKGILKTGDIGRYDEDGYVYITGRKSRFMKLYGMRICLDEVESVIEQKFNTIHCICTEKNEKLNVSVTDISYSEIIKEFLLKEFKINKNVVRIEYIDEIARNDSGKVNYGFYEKT